MKPEQRELGGRGNRAPATVAIVGAGPTAIYTIQALLRSAKTPFILKVFEKQKLAGRGTPYRPGWNDPAMLSNIPSIELPPIGPSLVEWLRAQPADKLARFDIEKANINDRAFYPRLLLGEYLKQGFDKLLQDAKAKGVEAEVCTGCAVLDVIEKPHGIMLVIDKPDTGRCEETFDYAVLATGHQWPEDPEVRPGYFSSPWPASALAKIGATKIGIRGASLTAIDALVAIATRHGAFKEQDGAPTAFLPAADSDALHITMMSRKGLLPEADFYGPIPYAQLEICTPEAIAEIIASHEDGLLDRTFALFKQQLTYSDPEYAAGIGLAGLTLEEFHDRYFEERLRHDPFEWAQKNLAEAQRNYAAKYTVPWRYAILCMHEIVEPLVPHLENNDYKRFSKYFKPVFVDDYATIPHKSIKRVLALHCAGKLDIMALGDDYRIDTSSSETGADIIRDGERIHFHVLIDATGQPALSAKDFPFPSLVAQGIVHNVSEQAGDAKRGIAIDDQFHPIAKNGEHDRLFCVSLPFILGRHPFHQGLTSAHEMGEEVGTAIAGMLSSQRLAQA